MVIMSAKLSKPKLLIIGLLIVLLAVVLIFCTKNAAKAPQSAAEGEVACASDIRTNDDRIAYLESYGWQVSAEPVKTQEVRIPEEPSDVFLRYNELQLSQGFDLTALSGKTVKRYVYKVENYPADDGCYYASLLIYKNEVVGGDVSSDAAGGVMHGFAMPD